MEFVLVRLQVAQLSKLLAALVQLAGVRLRGSVNDFVRPHVAVLRESLAAYVAVVGPLAGVPSLVCFEVAKLAEALAAVGFFTEKGLDAGVHAGVDVEVGLLAEGFVAAWDGAFVLLF